MQKHFNILFLILLIYVQISIDSKNHKSVKEKSNLKKSKNIEILKLVQTKENSLQENNSSISKESDVQISNPKPDDSYSSNKITRRKFKIEELPESKIIEILEIDPPQKNKRLGDNRNKSNSNSLDVAFVQKSSKKNEKVSKNKKVSAKNKKSKATKKINSVKTNTNASIEVKATNKKKNLK